MNLFFESLLFAQFELNLQLDKYFQAQPLFRYSYSDNLPNTSQMINFDYQT